MFNNTSDEKRGYEVALSRMFMVASSILGVLIGGYFLHSDGMAPGLTLGGIAFAAGSTVNLMLSPTRTAIAFREFITEYKQVYRDNQTQVRRVFYQQGLLEGGAWVMATLMHRLGYSALGTSSVLAVSMLLVTFITPLNATLIHKNKGHEQIVGDTLVIVSWAIMLLFPLTPVTLTIAILIRSTGFQFITSGIDTQWYKMRSYAALTVHETILNASRLLSALLTIPFFFISPYAYIIAIAVLSIAVLLIEYYHQRHA